MILKEDETEAFLIQVTKAVNKVKFNIPGHALRRKDRTQLVGKEKNWEKKRWELERTLYANMYTKRLTQKQTNTLIEMQWGFQWLRTRRSNWQKCIYPTWQSKTRQQWRCYRQGKLVMQRKGHFTWWWFKCPLPNLVRCFNNFRPHFSLNFNASCSEVDNLWDEMLVMSSLSVNGNSVL